MEMTTTRAHRDLFPQTLYRLLKLYKQMDIDTAYYIMLYIYVYLYYIWAMVKPMIYL